MAEESTTVEFYLQELQIKLVSEERCFKIKPRSSDAQKHHSVLIQLIMELLAQLHLHLKHSTYGCSE